MSMMLHDGKEDLQTIYYRAQGQIDVVQKAVVDLRKRGRFDHDQLNGSNILSLATRGQLFQFSRVLMPSNQEL